MKSIRSEGVTTSNITTDVGPHRALIDNGTGGTTFAKNTTFTPRTTGRSYFKGFGGGVTEHSLHDVLLKVMITSGNYVLFLMCQVGVRTDSNDTQSLIDPCEMRMDGGVLVMDNIGDDQVAKDEVGRPINLMKKGELEVRFSVEVSGY